MSPREQALLAASLGWRLSVHARTAAVARGFSLTQVLLTCVDPQVAYSASGFQPRRMVHQRDHAAVVVCPDTRTVITVLLRDGSPWNDADARRANGLAG